MLKEEMRTFDMKDSVVFELRINSLNKRKNPSMEIDPTSTISRQKAAIKDKSLALQKKKLFTESLWYCGKKVGEINGQMSFYNIPILYQMRVGVLTKHGIFFTSRPFLQESLNTNNIKLFKDSNNPLKLLNALKDKLILSDTGKIKTRLTLYESLQLCKEISSLLKTSHKTSMNSFVYSTEDDLMKA